MTREHDQRERRPVARDGRFRVPAAAAGRDGQAPSRRKHVKTTPTKSQKRSRLRSAPPAAPKRDPVPAAERVQIDDRERERHEQRDQDELDRPAAHDPPADPDVARRARGRARGPSSEPSSCWAAAPSWPSRVRVEARMRVAEGGRWAVAARRDRHRRDSGGDERALLVERVREGEVDQLAEEADVPRRGARSARRSGRSSSRRGSGSASAASRRRSRCSAGPCPPIASRSITATMRLRNGEVARKCAAPSPPKAPPSVERKTIVCGEDARGSRSPAGRTTRASSISAAVPLALSFAPGPGPDVVAVGHHDDHVGRLARRDRRDVAEPHAAEPGHVLRPRGPRQLEAVELRRQLVDEPVRRADRADAPRRAVRVLRRQVVSERERRAACRRSPAAPASRAASARVIVNASSSPETSGAGARRGRAGR